MHDAISQNTRKLDQMTINTMKKERKGKLMPIGNEVDVNLSLMLH
jgi:hypothetical protein